MRSMLLTLALLPTQAFAFCGTYVGAAGAELYNEVSQVIYVRQDDRTTITLANDYAGNLAKFALVIPVPEGLRQRDVKVVEPELIQRVDAYSSPRLVEYTCNNLYEPIAMAGYESMSCGPLLEGEARSEDSVTVEASFQRGEYDIVVLSATESAALFEWFDDNGYAVEGVKADVFQELIDSGVHFLAAKVDLGRVPDDRSTLSPLQITYRTTFSVLPIRLGTTSSTGVQDLILYTVGDHDDGALVIDNYPRAEPESECLWRPRSETFGAFYEGQFSTAVEEAGGTAWVLEYQWMGGKCDPCASDPLEKRDLHDFGFRGGPRDAVVTRLHLRMRAEDVSQDLLLVRQPSSWQQQMRFIRWEHELEDTFPVCGQGWVDDPGS
ncbi:MAG: DUF2330 domain-containing protein, partial [Deltaproteobacteria bacterium]|nr:DUF2330 domain-containing protein [Deltaproteobacteria bacterium]